MRFRRESYPVTALAELKQRQLPVTSWFKGALRSFVEDILFRGGKSSLAVFFVCFF